MVDLLKSISPYYQKIVYTQTANNAQVSRYCERDGPKITVIKKINLEDISRKETFLYIW